VNARVLAAVVVSMCACGRTSLFDAVAALSVEPGSLRFGTIAVGHNSRAPLTILSIGDIEATVGALRLQGDVTGDFKIPGDPALPMHLPPGAALEVQVSFAPSAAGDASATLAIESDADVGELAVPLSGTGTTPCSETTDAFCARFGGCGSVSGVDRCGVARTADCGSCPVQDMPDPNCSEDDAAFCKRLGKNCGEVSSIDACGELRRVRCGPTAADGSNGSLVLDVPDGCINDSGESAAGDSLEVYCVDDVMRFCLSGEMCPWRGGLAPPTESTCSPSGLLDPEMATIFMQGDCRQGLDAAAVCCYPNGVAVLSQTSCPSNPPP
jgi:hypothetical protein